MKEDWEQNDSGGDLTLFLVGWTTVSRQEDAENLAQALVGKGLAACVQIDPGVVSIYRWKDAIERESEVRLWVKFRADFEQKITDYLKEHHPYDTPQWVTVPMHSVSKEYGNWLAACQT